MQWHNIYDFSFVNKMERKDQEHLYYILSVILQDEQQQRDCEEHYNMHQDIMECSAGPLREIYLEYVKSKLPEPLAKEILDRYHDEISQSERKQSMKTTGA